MGHTRISDPMGYITTMANKAATKYTQDKRRRTTVVPVTTMEEIPVLSAKERADLLAVLKAAEGTREGRQGDRLRPEDFQGSADRNLSGCGR